jgi:excinuclease ABC subunit C
MRYKTESEEGLGEMGKFSKLPDLMMIDGGKGHVNAVEDVLQKLGLTIPVCGMVKDNRHRTRGLMHNDIEIPFNRHGEGFKLITRIQDEVHRFALEYHRKLRADSQVRSVLDDIKGIGAARRKALMRHFKGIEPIRKATAEELAQVDTMNKKTAEAVYNFFHG